MSIYKVHHCHVGWNKTSKIHSTFFLLINRPAVLEYGMWDQIRVDHGHEFYLLLCVQEKMANYRSNTGRAPFIQTMSKEVSLHVTMETRGKRN